MTDSLPNLTWRHVLNAVGLLLLILIVLPFIAYAMPQLVGASNSYIVESGSMQPTIDPGSVIFVYPTDTQSIQEGDIITYNLRDPDREVTTHRVVEVVRDGGLEFRTKGDANEEADQYLVPPTDVIGTVPTVVESLTIPGFGTVDEYPAQIPYLGFILVYASSQQGILVFVMIPAALLIVSEIYDLAMAYRAAKANQSDEGPSLPGDEYL